MEMQFQKHKNELEVKANLAIMEVYLADQRAQLGLKGKLVAVTDCIF